MIEVLQRGIKGFLKVARQRPTFGHPEIGVSFYATNNEKSNEKAEEVASDRSNADEDACSKLWAVYLGEAEKYDGELVAGWKDDMSDLVVFSSLYSSVLTAFIIESYRTLQPDSGVLTVSLLTQISQQLAAAANGTTVPFQTPNDFQPDSSSVICNLLWFLALVLALTCSLLAIFVQQWTRDFKQKTTLRPSPVLRAKIFMYSYFGMRKFGMHAVVDLIPFLLHISLLLFFVGLVEFLIPVNKTVQYLMSSFLAVYALVYLLLTFLPIIYLDAPFRTPLSRIFWTSGNLLSRCLQRAHGLRTDEDFSLTESALEKSCRDDIDRHNRKAMKFTIKSLTDDSELLPLLEAIPDAIYGSGQVRHSNVPLLAPFLTSDNSSLNIIARMSAFSSNPSAWLDEKVGIRCLTAYPRAIWSLAQVFVDQPLATRGSAPAAVNPSTARELTKVWFPDVIVNKLLEIEDERELTRLQLQNPQNHSATSALALLRFSQLRSLQARIAFIESRLHELSRGGIGVWGVTVCRDVTPVDWSEKISECFSRLHTYLQRGSLNGLDMSILGELRPTGREWVNAQIRILGEFLAKSIKPKCHYMLSETYNRLSQSIKHSLKDVELYIWDDELSDALCKPIQQFAELKYRNSLSDTLFILVLNHFHWDKRWASSIAYAAVQHRKVLQEQFLMSFDPVAVSEADLESQHLESCLLTDVGRRDGTPYKYLQAIWLFIHCLSGSENNHLRFLLFAGRVLKAFRTSGEACPVPRRIVHRPPPPPPLAPYMKHLKHPLHHLIQAVCGSVVCRDIITLLNFAEDVTSKLIPHDPIDLLETVKALGKELLPERTEFENFSYPPRDRPVDQDEIALVEDFCHYVQSINLILVARYINACCESFEEVKPFRVDAFKIVFNNFYKWRSHLPPIDESSQLQLAQSVKGLLAYDGQEDLRSDIFWTILSESFGNYSWLTYPEAARVLLEALDQHKDWDNPARNARKEILRDHCKKIAAGIDETTEENLDMMSSGYTRGN